MATVDQLLFAFTFVAALGCLDDVDPKELADAPIRYFDGRNNNCSRRPPRRGTFEDCVQRGRHSPGGLEKDMPAIVKWFEKHAMER